jgi:UDP-N-acetylglucosamine--dolichyl-phosphate N-acetylglucosaminephosphotransferase
LTLPFVIPLLFILLAMPPYLRFLRRKGRTTDDVHKQPVAKVPSPVGPVIFVAAAAGEVVAFLTFGTLVPLAVLGAAAIAFTIGLYDDLSVLGGKLKPLLLLTAAVPLIVSLMFQSNLYEPKLFLPILGATGEHFTIYTFLAVAAFPVVANAFNMMDSFNGEMSGFTFLASLALAVGITLHALASPGFSLAPLAAAVPLLAVSVGFYVFNRYPSRAFDGNSGSLALGTMFAALAITGGVEVAAIIAILPSILNSFYILSSLRGFVERRQMSSRPTYMTEDGKLHASESSSAPSTLVRLILLPGPLSEKELVRNILVLTAVSCLLSIMTSLLTWVH